MSRKSHESKVKRAKRNKVIRHAVKEAVLQERRKMQEEVSVRRHRSQPKVIVEEFYVHVQELREAYLRVKDTVDLITKGIVTLKNSSHKDKLANVDVAALDGYVKSVEYIKKMLDKLNHASVIIEGTESSSEKFNIVLEYSGDLSQATKAVASVSMSVTDLLFNIRAVMAGKKDSSELSLTCEDSYLDFDEDTSMENTNTDTETVVSKEQEAEVLRTLGVEVKDDHPAEDVQESPADSKNP